MTSSSGALEAVERILNRGGDADNVLRAVVDILHERGFRYAAVTFVDLEHAHHGPQAGNDSGATLRVPVVFQGTQVAEFELASTDAPLVRRIATLISPYCLGGRDTGDNAAAG